jgi:hypothetical protein
MSPPKNEDTSSTGSTGDQGPTRWRERCRVVPHLNSTIFPDDSRRECDFTDSLEI